MQLLGFPPANFFTDLRKYRSPNSHFLALLLLLPRLHLKPPEPLCPLSRDLKGRDQDSPLRPSPCLFSVESRSRSQPRLSGKTNTLRATSIASTPTPSSTSPSPRSRWTASSCSCSGVTRASGRVSSLWPRRVSRWPPPGPEVSTGPRLAPGGRAPAPPPSSGHGRS